MSLVRKVEAYSSIDLMDVFLQLFILKQSKLRQNAAQMQILVKKVLDFFNNIETKSHNIDEYMLIPQIKNYFFDSVQLKKFFKNTDHIKTFMHWFSLLSLSKRVAFLLHIYDTKRFTELSEGFKKTIKINRNLCKYPKFCEILPSKTTNPTKSKSLQDYFEGFESFFKEYLVHEGKRVIYTLNVMVTVYNAKTQETEPKLVKFYMVKVKNPKDYKTEIEFIKNYYLKKTSEDGCFYDISRVVINYIYC